MKATSKGLREKIGDIRLAGAVGALSLLSISLSACGSVAPAAPSTAEAATPQQPVAVQVTDVREGRMVASLSYTGDVKPRAQVNLTAKALGRIDALGVEVGDRVRAGDVVGHLDRAGLEAQLKQAQAALDMAKAKQAQVGDGPRPETIAQAQSNLDSAREKLASMVEGGRGETVAQAEAAVRMAQSKLAQLQAGPTPEQLQQAEAAVRAAKNQLYAVQSQADAYLGSWAVAAGGMVFTQDMKEAQSGTAYEQVAMAEARLAELKAGPTSEQLNQAQAAVDQARAALEVARRPFTAHDIKQAENAVIAAGQQLKLAENPFTTNDLATAQAAVAQAQANVDFVKTQLADTNIVAPIDGVVAEKHLSVGALASPQAPILTLISDELEITLPVEEARADQVRIGKPVALTVAAYPDQSFAGTVSSVSPTIDPRSRSFAVKVTPTDEEGKLKAGMLAKVSISFGERPAVLVVPEPAVIKRGTENSVFAVVDGQARARRVEVGISDGTNIEIKSGLTAGDTIVLGNTTLKDGDPVAVIGG